MLLNVGHNPDVLECLANLSNDEVFTPPAVANQVLDMLPEEIWRDETITFLDPVSKSGVFLREIAKRLIDGLEPKFPDLEERLKHIFMNQLFGIAITELTALLSRRTVYCSKTANGEYSVAPQFSHENGNIRFGSTSHTWVNGKCEFCGASESVYSRDSDMESHAYEFIHTKNVREIFDMEFDVIVGNPPYQLNDGGGMGTSATPLYHKFIEQAKKLNPRFMTMIIPARWYAGGKGLDEFRDTMLNDKRVSNLVDYFDSALCFPGVDISGGVCFFLWTRDYSGECEIKSIDRDEVSVMSRPLLEDGADTFIRFNQAVSIMRKVAIKKGKNFSDIVSARKPFGFSNPPKSQVSKFTGSVKVYSYQKTLYSPKHIITQNHDKLDAYKVFIAKAYGERGDFPYNVLAKPFIGEPGSCCSETYLLVNNFDSEEQARNVISYISTKFFRFLVLMRKNTQNAPRDVYSYVPIQDFDEKWTDEKLNKKYGLEKQEIEFIDSMVKPMELNNE